MKLWQVIQWGNMDDGPDGRDTQCIISAVDMQSAIKKAEIHLPYWDKDWGVHLHDEKKAEEKREWKHGAEVVYLIGQDDKPDGEAVLVIPVWIAMGVNLSHNPAWYLNHQTQGWETQEEMYGPESK